MAFRHKPLHVHAQGQLSIQSQSVNAVEPSVVVGSSQRSSSSATVVIDAYPNTATVEQGTTLALVCRVEGVPSTTVLSYQWTCPGGYCDAGGVDPEWAARIQQGNILVVNVRRQVNDAGVYTCTVRSDTQQVGTAMYTLTVASELCIRTGYAKYIAVAHSFL